MTIRPERTGRLAVVAGALLAACALVAWLLGGTDTTGDRDGQRTASSGAPGRQARSSGGDDGDERLRRGTAARRSSSTHAVTRVVRPGRPRRITIPAIGVRAPVVAIRTSGRVLVPPDDPAKVGWWSEGARPGARTGSAVLTGHTVSAGAGVFDGLDRVHHEDRITVTTSRGTLTYVVEDSVTYRKGSLSEHARRLFSQSVPGRLVLVTCENWNGEVYLSNHIVVALPG